MLGVGWLAFASILAGGPPAVVREWRFDRADDLLGWQPNGHLAEVRVADGALHARCVDWDPFFTSEVFEVAAGPWQWVEIELRADRPGDAELFWTGTTQSEHGGFSGEKRTPFPVAGTGDWETIRLEPFWQAEGRIVLLRLDLFDGGTFDIRAIRVLAPTGSPTASEADRWDFTGGFGDWSTDGVSPIDGRRSRLRVERALARVQSPPLALRGRGDHWVTVRMSSRGAAQGELLWAAAERNGLQSLRFPLRADGLPHVYNLDVGSHEAWTGSILAVALRPGTTVGAEAEIESLAIADEPQGGPDLELVHAGLRDAVNRVGLEVPVITRFVNHGAEPARGLQVGYRLPDGVRLVTRRPAPELVAEFGVPVEVTDRLIADRPVDEPMTVTWRVDGGRLYSRRVPLAITPSLGLPRADYVPPPVPAETDYLVGSYYFPGWWDASRWEPIHRVAPIRKPVLGWYDEALPEVVDWQIKWALEHGVKFFLVDWYWSAGSRSLEHWLHDGFMKSRYHDQFQWAVMWANHNAPDTHSPDDWRAVTQYWIDHYLRRDDYLRIDGKPAVFVWAPSNIRRDVGGSDPAAALYAMSQQMARDAGLPGIYFVSMNAGGQGAFEELRREGYEAATSYHGFFGATSKAPDPRYFPFSLVVDESPPGWATWRADAEGAGLRYLPVADTGWDARPWHDDRSFVIHDRTVAEWERLLGLAKEYLDAHDERMLILGPWNEWGEGSYLEPCAEWGFDMLQAIRRVFGRDPRPPLPVTPIDVGLGPYEFESVGAPPRSSWTFDDGPQGWGGMMNLAEVAVRDGALVARTTGGDSAFQSNALNLFAKRFGYLVIRMRQSPGANATDTLQVFWSTGARGTSEETSVKCETQADGQWHTYVLPVGENGTWRGMIRSLRLDPCTTAGAEISLDSVELRATAP